MEPGTTRWVEERSRKVCNLAAEGRMEIRGVVCARCVGSGNRGMMGCGVIHTAVLAIGPASLWFLAATKRPKK